MSHDEPKWAVAHRAPLNKERTYVSHRNVEITTERRNVEKHAVRFETVYGSIARCLTI